MLNVVKPFIFLCLVLLSIYFVNKPRTPLIKTVSEQHLVAITVDEQTLECSDPLPTKDSVGFGLSFVQTRNCRVLLQKNESGANSSV